MDITKGRLYLELKALLAHVTEWKKVGDLGGMADMAFLHMCV